MSPETAKFIPKFIEAVEAGHIVIENKSKLHCFDSPCKDCNFYLHCEEFARLSGKLSQENWNTSYQLFIQPYINYKESSIRDFKLKYPELFI